MNQVPKGQSLSWFCCFLQGCDDLGGWALWAFMHELSTTCRKTLLEIQQPSDSRSLLLICKSLSGIISLKIVVSGPELGEHHTWSGAYHCSWTRSWYGGINRSLHAIWSNQIAARNGPTCAWNSCSGGFHVCWSSHLVISLVSSFTLKRLTEIIHVCLVYGLLAAFSCCANSRSVQASVLTGVAV